MIVGLLVVRLIWGFADTTHGRFVILATIHLRPSRNLGHNPAAGAMVVSLLLILGATATTGIMITTDTSLGEACSRACGKPRGRTRRASPHRSALSPLSIARISFVPSSRAGSVV